MFVDLSAGAVGIRLPFDQLLPLASEAGFEGVDLPIGELLASHTPPQVVEALGVHRLKCGTFGLPVEFRKDDALFQRDVETLREHASFAAACGCTRTATWIMPGHDELDHAANLRRHAQRLGICADILGEHGIRLGLEFVGPLTLQKRFKYPFLRTIDGLLELIALMGRPNVGCLLDSFHWHASAATAEDITTKLADKIVFVHVNDAIPGRSREEQIDNERALPAATGVIDAAAFVSALRAVKYDGPVAAEPFMSELGRQPPEQTAQQVADATRKMLQSA
jgi:sugar phosphate isomerase/epimerase